MRTVSSLRSGRMVSIMGLLLALSLLSPASLWASPSSARTARAGVAQPSQGRTTDIQALSDGLAYVPNEVLLKPKDPSLLRVEGNRVFASSPDLSRILGCYGLQSAGEVLPGVYKLSAPANAGFDVMAAAEALRATGAVEYAQPNNILYANLAPDDEQYKAGQQWGVTQIKAEQAWDITTGADNIVIAILDTGTARDHPDLQGKVVAGYDFINNDSDPSDDHGHGTYTAGIAGASSNNGTGVTGISWGARIMPVKVLSARGSGSDETIARGVRWAVDNGARIVSASLGGEEGSDVQRDALQYAHDRNVLVVAASGNTPDGKPHYPAAYDTVLAVGATGRSDTVTGFSSYGQYVDVSAPGVGILSTGWDNGRLTYEYGNGTSASCPFVSGVAALVWSVNPALTADQVRYIIEDSSDDVGPAGRDEFSGKGRLNAFRAVQMAQQGPPPSRTPTPVAQPSATAGPTSTPAPKVPPTLQVDTKEVTAGALVAIIGSGFGANELVDLSLTPSDSRARGIGNAQTDAQGGFRAEVALPKELPTGKASLVATGAKSNARAQVDLNVAAGQSGGGGRSMIRGTVSGAATAGITVRLKPALGVSGPELTAQPDGHGEFIFANLASGFYSLSASAPGYLPAGPFSVQVDGTAADIKLLNINLAAGRPGAFERSALVPNSPTQTYFPQVGHALKGPFLRFWQANGGLAIFGYPISDEFQETSPTDGKSYTVQYFERNRFELHPEFAGSRNEVLMGLLGIEMTKGRSFLPGVPFASTPTQAYFNETKHSLSGPFLKYWQAKGGLPIFGYPISEELMENGYLVQYFERNRFEYHPEFAGTDNEVLLGLLGVEIAKRNGWITP